MPNASAATMLIGIWPSWCPRGGGVVVGGGTSPGARPSTALIPVGTLSCTRMAGVSVVGAASFATRNAGRLVIVPSAAACGSRFVIGMIG